MKSINHYVDWSVSTMNFNNFTSYITLINNDCPPNDFKYFEINTAEVQINIPQKDFKFENISDFYIETNCDILESNTTHVGKNLQNKELYGFVTNIKIELKEILEYTSENSEINIFLNEDFIGSSLLSPNPIANPNVYLNFVYVFKESKSVITACLIYTIYIK